MRQGILFKKQTNLPFARIQNVSFEHPFYFKPLDLVTVNMDSPGSASDEVHLSALKLSGAQSIHARIKTVRRTHRSEETQEKLFGVDHIIIELHKLQKGRFTQTPLIKRHGLGSLSWVVASRTVTMPFLEANFARQMLDYGLFQSESSARSWM